MYNLVSIEDKLTIIHNIAYKMSKINLEDTHSNMVYNVLDGVLDVSHIINGRCSLQESIDFDPKDYEDRVDWYLTNLLILGEIYGLNGG